MQKIFILSFFVFSFFTHTNAQTQIPAHFPADTVPYLKLLQHLSKFSFAGHGAMNYYNFAWQTDTAKRDAIDNERFILDFKYRWTDKIRLNTEIEFEHGGTGVDLEFDRFEEFGEFEFDVSKGGEVLIEQMNLEFQVLQRLNVKVGRVKVPFALMFNRDEPNDYLTNVNSEMETQMLPENWTENGILVSGKLLKNNKLNYYFSLVNGLDGSAFNSANWIKRGNQRRFEMVTAENFAAVARLDYDFNPDFVLGASFYTGNTTNNRPKPDLRVSTPIYLTEIHANYTVNPFRASAMLFYGSLTNSEALSTQNRNLSNNLNVKRTPVGAAAVGAFAEFGLVLFGKKGIVKKWETSEFLLYGRADYYDTMYETEGLIFNNPRWARQSFSFGGVFSVIEQVQFKAQYTMRKVGAPAATSVNGGTAENTFVAGFCFEF
jgi:hypothetical protein